MLQRLLVFYLHQIFCIIKIRLTLFRNCLKDRQSQPKIVPDDRTASETNLFLYLVLL